MTQNNQLRQKTVAGFTLVELAIVMIIIGLLIGGILKGQELVENARLEATINQIKGIESATATFQDKYKALPGDMLNPNLRFPNCPAPPCSTGGNGDGHLDTVPGMGGGAEGANFFTHLWAADLITGINPNLANPNVFGGRFPTTPLGGGVTMGESSPGAAGNFNLVINATGLPSGLYLGFWDQLPYNGVAPFTPNEAQRIDSKLDDGAPTTGVIRPIQFGACGIAGPGGVFIYNETVSTKLCGLYVLAQR